MGDEDKKKDLLRNYVRKLEQFAEETKLSPIDRIKLYELATDFFEHGALVTTVATYNKYGGRLGVAVIARGKQEADERMRQIVDGLRKRVNELYADLNSVKLTASGGG